MTMPVKRIISALELIAVSSGFGDEVPVTNCPCRNLFAEHALVKFNAK